jgi:hypothetical protein
MLFQSLFGALTGLTSHGADGQLPAQARNAAPPSRDRSLLCVIRWTSVRGRLRRRWWCVRACAHLLCVRATRSGVAPLLDIIRLDPASLLATECAHEPADLQWTEERVETLRLLATVVKAGRLMKEAVCRQQGGSRLTPAESRVST